MKSAVEFLSAIKIIEYHKVVDCCRNLHSIGNSAGGIDGAFFVSFSFLPRVTQHGVLLYGRSSFYINYIRW